MWTSIAVFFSATFAGLQGLLIAAGAAAVISGTTVGVLVHKVDSSKMAAVELADARATTKAVELAKVDLAKRDKVTLDTAVKEADAQQKIVTRTVTLTKEVKTYVHEKALPCIPLGFIRLLDAAALEADPDTLPLPAGDNNDTCAALTAAALAEGVVSNYGTGQQNAEQLTAAQNWIAAQEAVNTTAPTQ